MANHIKASSEKDLQTMTVPELAPGEDFHVTVASTDMTVRRRFDTPSLASEEHLTIVEYPDGERGAGGICLGDVVNLPFFLAFSAVWIFGKAYIEEYAKDTYRTRHDKPEALSGGLKEALSDHWSPSQFRFLCPERSASFIVLAPARLASRDLDAIECLGSKRLAELEGGAYEVVFFSPDDEEFRLIYRN